MAYLRSHSDADKEIITPMTITDILEHIGTGTKYVLDTISATVAVGVIMQALPPLAAAMTILWTGLQIYGWFTGRQQATKDT